MEYADFFFFGQVVQAKFKKKKERGEYMHQLFSCELYFFF